MAQALSVSVCPADCDLLYLLSIALQVMEQISLLSIACQLARCNTAVTPNNYFLFIYLSVRVHMISVLDHTYSMFTTFDTHTIIAYPANQQRIHPISSGPESPCHLQFVLLNGLDRRREGRRGETGSAGLLPLHTITLPFGLWSKLQHVVEHNFYVIK